MEVLVSAQAPWPPPDPRGLVHPWMGSRWSTQRLSWLPLCCVGALCACWFAVHVSALRACHPCSSASSPSPLSALPSHGLFWAQKLQFLLSPSTHVQNSCSCCLSSCSNLGWCLQVGSGGEGPAGCDRTFSACLPCMKGVGNQTLPELCHSQRTNPGKLHGGDVRMSRGVDFGGRFFPKRPSPCCEGTA